MADLALSGTLLLADTLIAFLNQRDGHENVHVEVGKLANWLKLMKSYITDEQPNETQQVAKDLVMQARDVAYDIEDILDEYMLRLSRAEYHSYAVTTFASKIFHYPADKRALGTLSDNMKTVESKIEQLSKGRALLRPGNSTSDAVSEGGSLQKMRD